MKKINIIRRNLLLSLLLVTQYIVYLYLTWPEFIGMVRHPEMRHLQELPFWSCLISAIAAGWGVGLLGDTLKAYGQHRRWKAGELTHY